MFLNVLFECFKKVDELHGRPLTHHTCIHAITSITIIISSSIISSSSRSISFTVMVELSPWAPPRRTANLRTKIHRLAGL